MTAAISAPKTGVPQAGDERNQLIVTERVRSGVRLHDERVGPNEVPGEVALQVALLRLGTLRRSELPDRRLEFVRCSARVDGHHPSLVAPFARL